MDKEMEAVTIPVVVGPDRRLVLDLPPSIPTGPADVVILLLDRGDEPYHVLSWRNASDGSTAPQRALSR